jgi:hypothetical protein
MSLRIEHAQQISNPLEHLPVVAPTPSADADARYEKILLDEKSSDIIFTSGIYTFRCPHCRGVIQVHAGDIACQIFRHGVIKANQSPINPHASKEECDKLVASGTINGCAGPFKFDGKSLEVCGYI